MIKIATAFIALSVLWGEITFAANDATANSVPRVGSIVTGVYRLQLFETIGGEQKHELRGSPALVLELIEKHGETWHRLLGPEGTYGWTKKRLHAIAPTTLSIRYPNARIAKFPLRDDPDFDDKVEKEDQWVHAQQGEQFIVAGATEKANLDYPNDIGHISPMSMSTPNIFMAPSLKILNSKDASLGGWIGIGNSSLQWKGKDGTVPSLAMSDLIQRYQYEGMVSAPFLGPITDRLRKFLPKVGNRVLRMDQVGEEPIETNNIGNTWDNAELLVSPSPSNGKLPATLVVYRNKSNRAFTFIANGHISAQIIVDEYAPQVLDFRTIDLNNDGYNEWLLDIDTVYGDGSYRVAWIVDGKSLTGKVMLYQHPIDGSNYEPSGSEIYGYWWLDKSNGTTLFWHLIIDGTNTTATPFVFKDGKLHLATKSRQVYAVLSHKKTTIDSKPFALYDRSGIRNVYGRVFLQETVAKQWLNSQKAALSKLSIRPLPIAK